MHAFLIAVANSAEEGGAALMNACMLPNAVGYLDIQRAQRVKARTRKAIHYTVAALMHVTGKVGDAQALAAKLVEAKAKQGDNVDMEALQESVLQDPELVR